VREPRKKMELRKYLTNSIFLVLIASLVVFATRCQGGVTSKYRRQLEASVDMPLDSDVFRVPAGYNAPQQVLPFLNFLI
jgi:hypothetical protein